MSAHVVLSGSEKSAPRAKKFSGLDGNEIIQVTLRLSPPIDAPDSDSLIAARRLCSRENYEAIFGARAEAFAAVERFARRFNLSVVEKRAAARIVKLSGSVQHMQEAFQVFLANYEHSDGTTFRGRTGAVQIPSELEGIVEGVFGLDSRPQAHPRFLPLRTVQGMHVSPQSQPASFNPNDLAPLYDFPAGDGSNQCVAIIELG